MRVLYLINHAGKAGTEKYVRELVDAFNGKLAECFFAYSEPGLLSEQMQERGIKSFQVTMKNPFDLSAAKKLAKICKEHKIDVIHAQYPRENYVAILSKLFCRVKVVYTCHLTYETNALWHLTNMIMTRHNHKIISVCNDGKRILIKNGVPKDKITVIYNGLEYPPDPPAREKNDVFTIVTLARYHIAKGLPFLCEAMAALKRKTDEPFKCLILGDGELWDEIGEKIASLGLEDTVIRMGFRKDVPELLLKSDLFINTAKCYEALSFAILEALSSGLPVVATDVGGNCDIINEETDCGKIVPYGDAEGFADAVKAIMDDKALYDRYAKNAVAAVRTRFNIADKLDEIYKTY